MGPFPDTLLDQRDQLGIVPNFWIVEDALPDLLKGDLVRSASHDFQAPSREYGLSMLLAERLALVSRFVLHGGTRFESIHFPH